MTKPRNSDGTIRRANWPKRVTNRSLVARWVETESLRLKVMGMGYQAIADHIERVAQGRAADGFDRRRDVIGTLNGPRGGYAPGYYLLDAWRGKVAFADLKRRVVDFYQTWRPQAVLVEDAASGQSLIQELRSGTSLPVIPVRVDRDKLSRVAAVTPTLEARRLLLPESVWWRNEFIAELTSFPAGAHDDWVDALAQALLWISQNPPWQAGLEAFMRLYSAIEDPEEEPDSLVAAKLIGAPEAFVRHFQRRKK